MDSLIKEIIELESGINGFDSDYEIHTQEEINEMTIMKKLQLLDELKSKFEKLTNESKKNTLINKINNYGIVTKKELKDSGFNSIIRDFDYYRFDNKKYAVPKGYVNNSREQIRLHLDEKIKEGAEFNLSDLINNGHPIVIEELKRQEVEKAIKQGKLNKDGEKLIPNYIVIGRIHDCQSLISKKLIERIDKALNICGSHFVDDSDIFVNYKGKGSYGDVIFKLINYFKKSGYKASNYGGGLIVEK